MRSQLFLAAIAAAAVSFPIAANAADAPGPAFGAFKSTCWAAAGDYVAAVKSTSADGWKDAPVVADADNTVSITDKTAREKTVDGDDLTVLITRGLRHMSNGADVKVETCKLVASKGDMSLIPQAKGWLGAAPDSGDSGLAVYYVKLGAGDPQHIVQSQLGDAMNGGGFGVLKFQQDSGSGILVYQVYTK